MVATRDRVVCCSATNLSETVYELPIEPAFVIACSAFYPDQSDSLATVLVTAQVDSIGKRARSAKPLDLNVIFHFDNVSLLPTPLHFADASLTPLHRSGSHCDNLICI